MRLHECLNNKKIMGMNAWFYNLIIENTISQTSKDLQPALQVILSKLGEDYFVEKAGEMKDVFILSYNALFFHFQFSIHKCTNMCGCVASNIAENMLETAKNSNKEEESIATARSSNNNDSSEIINTSNNYKSIE